MTEAEAMQAMQDLVKTIQSEQEDVENEDVQVFVQEICSECIQILQEPEKSQAKSAMKIICALLPTTGLYAFDLCVLHV
jgi:DNA repair/transcription protein MET18/MMS19